MTIFLACQCPIFLVQSRTINGQVKVLQIPLNGLEPVLPRVLRVTLSGVGHLAADNSGKHERVAAELRKFFR